MYVNVSSRLLKVMMLLAMLITTVMVMVMVIIVSELFRQVGLIYQWQY